MSKAMIITVGKQWEQIKFCLNERKPQYLVLLGTRSEECKKSIDEILTYYKIPPTQYKILNEIDDNPEEISSIIHYFLKGLKWLTKEVGIPESEIEVDPTGGRKWMSAGLTMIASFLGLEMLYVQDKPKMEVISIGNAFQQTGFLEESKADKLFNSCNFEEAAIIYDFLMRKARNPIPLEIKKLIAIGYQNWSTFKFQKGFDNLTQAISKIQNCRKLEEYRDLISKQVRILQILKKNEESENNKQKYTFLQLLQEKEFSETVLLFLYALQNSFSENKQFEQAVLILYRILELIAQYRLALLNIDTSHIQQEIKERYNEEFKKITKKILDKESEIGTKIGLMEDWILLYCLEDKIIGNIKFLENIRGQIEPRNYLWIEHGNKGIDEEKYAKFKRFVEKVLRSIIPDIDNKISNFLYIKFKEQILPH